MCLTGKVKSFGNDFYLLTMFRSQIAVQQMLKSVINDFLFGQFFFVLLVHDVSSYILI